MKQFEVTMKEAIEPSVEELTAFLRDNGFRVSSPLQEQGRRSYKFELAENAYLLTIFRFAGVGEFELRTEIFVPGNEPVLNKMMFRVADVDEAWTQRQFREGLESFVELLSGEAAPVQIEELAAV